jgi:hypothetical protein
MRPARASTAREKEISKQVVADVRHPALTLRMPTNVGGVGGMVIGSRGGSPNYCFCIAMVLPAVKYFRC